MNKKVSVVLCTYNGEEFLKEQLDSIVNQTYIIHELIIQDDCSTDSTISIINEYAKIYPFIKIYINNHQLGPNNNFFSAFFKTTGEYIAIADQDDIWDNNKIDILISNINDNYLIFSNEIIIKNQKEEFNKSFEFISWEHLILSGGIPGHNMLFSKKILNYLDKVYITYDWDLLTVAAYLEKVTWVSNYLVKWRRHNMAVTVKAGERTYSKWDGYILGCKIILSKKKHEKNLNTLLGLKSLIDKLSNNEISANKKFIYQFTQYLPSNSFPYILKSCILCYINRYKLYGNSACNLPVRLRSFFFPFFFNLRIWNIHYFKSNF
jgi:glycosyltransferase involved in cell wall biosynthesis